jgi:hypothetical protein
MITGDRNAFIGGHVKKKVKTALQEEALKNSKSMSAYISEALTEKLIRAGREELRPEDAK